jgi:hypothetical protein
MICSQLVALAQSSGNENMFTGHPVRVVGGEKYRDRCNIFGLTPAAEGGLRDESLNKIAIDQTGCVHPFGLNETRIDRIDSDMF